MLIATTRRTRCTALGVLLIAILALVGCDKTPEKKPATQVAARVNSEEITVHQVQNVLARTPNLAAESLAPAKRQLLERLIDVQLAKEQAVEKKLDRSPNVVQAVESAKTEILARAYLEQTASAVAKPTPEEIKKFYKDNPELFSQRRVFHVEEVVARAQPGLASAVREQAARTKSVQAISAFLKSKNVAFIHNERILASEEVPRNLLPQLHNTRDGEIQVSEAGDRLSIVRIVSSRSAPIDETAASGRIAQFLMGQRTTEAMSNEMKRLRQIAKIEYLGEFSDDAKPVAPPATKPIAPAPGKDERQDTAPNFDKALRGLK